MLVGRTDANLDAAKLASGGGDKLAICIGDIASQADTAAFVKATVAAFGGVDILFANAGNEGTVKPLTTLNVDEFD